MLLLNETVAAHRLSIAELLTQTDFVAIFCTTWGCAIGTLVVSLWCPPDPDRASDTIYAVRSNLFAGWCLAWSAALYIYGMTRVEHNLRTTDQSFIIRVMAMVLLVAAIIYSWSCHSRIMCHGGWGWVGVWYRLMPYCVVLCCVMSCRTISRHGADAVRCHVVSYHVIGVNAVCHVISRHVMV